MLRFLFHHRRQDFPSGITSHHLFRSYHLAQTLSPSSDLATGKLTAIRDPLTKKPEPASYNLATIMGGGEITLARANIRGSSSAGQSLMPEGLEAGLSARDMADLLTFIEQLK